MPRALAPDQYEERNCRPCAIGCTEIVSEADGHKHVYRTMPDGTRVEIVPPPEWDGTPFDELTLPNAAGTTKGKGVEQIAEALWRAGLRTVRELRNAWLDNDWRLYDGMVQLPNQPGSNPMFATRARIVAFMRHLERRRAEWERRETQ